MTDAEIIKNLECCTNDDDEPNCKECTKRPHIYCMCELLEEALELIKRQQEEIQKYKTALEKIQMLIDLGKEFEKAVRR